MPVFLMEQVGATVLSTLPEGFGTTGAQEVHVGGDAASPFPRHPQRLGTPLPDSMYRK